MKCDMHVHTIHSGMCTVPGMRLICRESYNHPEALYEKLKRQGMDIVTVTDHDSIDAVEALRRHPDFFLSEEVTCRLPSGTELHVGVYNITERQHIEIQRRRDDFLSLHAYLTEEDLLFSANHVFSHLTGRRTAEDFEWFEHAFPALETRNGCMLARTNKAASQFAELLGKAPIAGSDAHAGYSLGSCWTEIPEARTKEEFLTGLRLGMGQACGESGSYWKLTRDVLWIGMRMVKENPLTLPVTVLSPLAPVITLINYVMEARFARHWTPRVLASRTQQIPAFATAGEEVAA
ncbi:MAG: glycosyl transferase group 1 [Bryobacterales bacterium]|nr:glycosyl transferase group 1 [Bryobacterales bacterium]